MVRNLKDLDDILKKALLQNSLITHKEEEYIYHIQASKHLSFLEIIAKEKIIEDVVLIQLLNKYCNVPLVTKDSLGIKVDNRHKFTEYVRDGYFVLENMQQKPTIVTYNLELVFKLFKDNTDSFIITLITKVDFYYFLEQEFSQKNLVVSTDMLESLSKNRTAKSINYPIWILTFLALFISTIFGASYIFQLLSNLSYFLQNTFKLVLFKRSLISKFYDIPIINNIEDLPIYTVLIPLYKEAPLLESILNSVALLNYPKDKLDVKLILEEDDNLLVKAIEKIEIPEYIQILKVPFKLPRTKPKALNYAAQYARGKYLVVYDAEDKPHPTQLIESVSIFEKLPENYACLQAKLNFYNRHENILSRLFSIEYQLWFNYLLEGLSSFNLPIPLGGTSNHFKTDILRKVGFWDAYNVTEDADLGLRLYLAGYKVFMVNTWTLEESTLKVKSWINQRSRWIKGFMQTFIVFLKQKNSLSKISLTQYTSVIIFIGISVYNFFCLPWVILVITYNENTILNYLWIGNAIFSFIYLYSVAYFIIFRNTSKLKYSLIDWITLTIWPLYFLLHTIACYKALWEICTQPFFWNKTKHGVKLTGK
jgi:cellulose synthase/poly-beta-1,6-N-acetylglucosamine synthase-like glycosyltransferase